MSLPAAFAFTIYQEKQKKIQKRQFIKQAIITYKESGGDIRFFKLSHIVELNKLSDVRKNYIKFECK